MITDLDSPGASSPNHCLNPHNIFTGKVKPCRKRLRSTTFANMKFSSLNAIISSPSCHATARLFSTRQDWDVVCHYQVNRHRQALFLPLTVSSCSSSKHFHCRFCNCRTIRKMPIPNVYDSIQTFTPPRCISWSASATPLLIECVYANRTPSSFATAFLVAVRRGCRLLDRFQQTGNHLRAQLRGGEGQAAGVLQGRT